MTVKFRVALLLSGTVLLAGCAGVLRPPDDPDPLDPLHPAQVEQAKRDAELRKQHEDAHEAARRAAEEMLNEPPIAPPATQT